MKKFIASTLVFFSSFSFAMSDSDVFVASDESGLKIVLVSDKCPIQGLSSARISFAIFKNKLMVGCWFISGDKVNVLWVPNNEQPIESIYDVDICKLEKIV